MVILFSIYITHALLKDSNTVRGHINIVKGYINIFLYRFRLLKSAIYIIYLQKAHTVILFLGLVSSCH